MKTKLAQFVSFVSKFDRRNIQYAYFVLVLVGFAIMQKPSDGSIGPF